MRAQKQLHIVGITGWSELARQRWDKAFHKRVFFDPGPRISWSEQTKKNVAHGYGAWLGWRQLIKSTSPSTLSPGPTELVDYVIHLIPRYSRATVRTRIVCLERAIFVLDPAAPRDAYKPILKHLRDDVPCQWKRQRLQSSRTLFKLGMEIMDEARRDPSNKRERALRFRNGFQIALLALKPLRRKNFAGLRLGEHLCHQKGRWRIIVPEEETKTRKPIDVPFPSALVDQLDYYLKVIRPRLLKTATDALWISQFGGAQSAHCLYLTIARWTAARFGNAINLHLFRDCAATSIAIEDPASIGIIASILGHGSLATSQKHYNQARSIDASRKFSLEIERLRRQHGLIGARVHSPSRL